MKRFILSVGALLLSCAMLAACGQKDNFIAVDTTPTAIAAETRPSNSLRIFSLTP